MHPHKINTLRAELSIGQEHFGHRGPLFIGFTHFLAMNVKFGCLLAHLTSLIAVTSSGANFVDLGLLPGGTRIFGSAVSDDGSVAVGSGNSSSFSEQPFRWTADRGMVGLDLLPGYSYGTATAMSGDGSVIVGDNSAPNQGVRQAVFWTLSGGPFVMGTLGGCCVSSARAVSSDGTIAVGYSQGTYIEAFRWTQNSGMVGLGRLQGSSVSYAYGISRNGAVIIGESGTPSTSQAFRWNQAAGMLALGRLPGDLYGQAVSVSRDGSIIVGNSAFDQNHGQAFRWTPSGGMVGLGWLPGGEGTRSYVTGVSGDGSVVIGASGSASGGGGFLWDARAGMQPLEAVLAREGINLPGWRLGVAEAISEDGSRIIGFGNAPDGSIHTWIALLPQNAPPTVACPDARTVECAFAPAWPTITVSDSEFDALTVVWTVNGAVVQTNMLPGSPGPGPRTPYPLIPIPQLPLGTNVVEVTVADAAGNTASCSTSITVVDTTPPVIHRLTADPDVLWPPKHKLVTVQVDAEVTDTCGPVTWKIIGVTSDEALAAKGSGRTSTDWKITGDHTVQLRAERSGKGGERNYTIAIQATDQSGNTAQEKVFVTVRHDQRKNQAHKINANAPKLVIHETE